MALILRDRVRETSSSSGTADMALAGAVLGYRAFSDVLSVVDVTWYSIVAGVQWETGLGTYGAGNTLQRTTVFESSDGGSKVAFAAGSKDVFLTLPSSRVQAILNEKLDKTGGVINGRLTLALGDLGTNNGTADFASRNVWKVTQTAAMTLTVSNLADGNDGQVNLSYAAGALSFSGITRWVVNGATVSTSFADTEVGQAGLVAGAKYQFVFSNIGGTITGRAGKV